MTNGRLLVIAGGAIFFNEFARVQGSNVTHVYLFTNILFAGFVRARWLRFIGSRCRFDGFCIATGGKGFVGAVCSGLASSNSYSIQLLAAGEII